MPISAAQLEVRVTSDVAAALSGLNRVNKAVTGTGGFLAGAAQSALGFVGGMAALNVVAGAVAGVSNAVLGMNSTLEGSQIALETMLGSSKAAGDQLDALKRFATATPFELPQLLDAQQRLLAFGFKVQDVIPLLTNLGDAAAGLNLGGGGLSRLVTAIGQIQAKGKVQGDELLQLTEAGVPALQLLATHLGKSTEETQKLVSVGKVGAGTFLEAFQSFATANFGGLMAKQSRTFEGAMSNIRDAVGFGLADAFAPVFALIRSLAVELAALLQTPAFDAFVQGVKSGVASLVEPLGAFLTMVGTIAQGQGLNLFQAGLAATQGALEQAFGPNTAQLFTRLTTYVGELAGLLATMLAPAFAWLGERVPGWIEAAAGALLALGDLLGRLDAALAGVRAAFFSAGQAAGQTLLRLGAAVQAAIATIQTTVFGMLDGALQRVEALLRALAALPVIGGALGGAADAIAAQRAALPTATTAAGVAAAGGGGVGSVNITFGDVSVDSEARVHALAAAIADAVAGAAEQAEPGPGGSLAGVLP